MHLTSLIEIARGDKSADLVLKGGRIVNVHSCEIVEADVAIAGDRIVGIGSYEGKETVDLKGQYICPGFIDAHVHIESSLMGVSEFANVVAAHGTTAVVADPHEIANVLGVKGIEYMIAAGEGCPIDVYIMASSCVPASGYESPGAVLKAKDIEPLLKNPRVLGLAEMMNYPGVVAGDPECLAKIEMTGEKTVDGHAPGLSGKSLCAYISAGIGSDHECTTADEAREKLRLGLHIMIREGSQARNLDALLPLVKPETLGRFMFVTDDKDVEDLLAEGQIDHIIRRAIAGGLNPVHAVRLATDNPARYFGLRDLGAIVPGRSASLAIVDDLKRFNVTHTYHRGQLVAQDGEIIDSGTTQTRQRQSLPNTMNLTSLSPDRFAVRAPVGRLCSVHVIEALEDRIDTERSVEKITPIDGFLVADLSRDLCKMAVIERHHKTGRIGLGFVRGFGFKSGAIASTVGHDAHNLIVAGVDDRDMAIAANRLIKTQGGLCVARDGKVLADVPLPIAGLMSNANAQTLNEQLHGLHEAAATLGGKMRRPFMLLSFLCLSVIGKLKLTDQGLVDHDGFKLTDLVLS